MILDMVEVLNGLDPSSILHNSMSVYSSIFNIERCYVVKRSSVVCNSFSRSENSIECGFYSITSDVIVSFWQVSIFFSVGSVPENMI